MNHTNRKETLKMKRIDGMSGLGGNCGIRSTKMGAGSHYHMKVSVEKSNNNDSANNRSRVKFTNGSRQQLIMWPKFNQVFLAFITLLFFVSCEYLLYTVITINPGLISRSFEPTQCKVINKFFNGNTSCFVESLANHGAEQVLPCLQVYVKPVSNEQNQVQGYSSRKEINSATSQPISSFEVSHQAALLHNQASGKECGTECKRSARNLIFFDDVLLMYQNEYNFAGMDDVYRQCSYLPPFCSYDKNAMLSNICLYAYNVGDVNTTISCFYDSVKKRVIYKKTVSIANIIHSLLWPILGVVVSVVCCAGFWNRNHKHISRLYIYNSWSAS